VTGKWRKHRKPEFIFSDNVREGCCKRNMFGMLKSREENRLTSCFTCEGELRDAGEDWVSV